MLVNFRLDLTLYLDGMFFHEVERLKIGNFQRIHVLFTNKMLTVEIIKQVILALAFFAGTNQVLETLYS